MIVLMLVVSYGIDSLFETSMRRFDDRLTDVLLHPRLVGNAVTTPHLVHIDANFYYKRSDHARIIRQLTDLGAAVIAVDHIFTGRSEPAEDRLLIETLRGTGNVLLGAGFESIDGITTPLDSIASLQWPPPLLKVGSERERFLPSAVNPTFPAPELAMGAAGVGFTDLPKDAGDTPRRIPVLAAWGGGLYPGLGFLAACRFLNIAPESIRITPGSIILTLPQKKSVEFPSVLEIPLDADGFMRLNVIGAPPEIPHIGYGDLVAARNDSEKTEKLKSMISGRIALISEVVEPVYRIPGHVPDLRVSSGAIHATAIHNILSGRALKRIPQWEMLFIELMLGTILVRLFARTNPYSFVPGVVLLGIVFCIGAWMLIVFFSRTVHLTRPLLFLALVLITGLLTISVERAVALSRAQRARRLAERELEIGRQIQSDFFPVEMPAPKHYELIHHFQAARHVSGDFYDAFWLDNRPSRLGIVVADVCDKGVGAALFMALVRTLIRVLSGEVNVLKNAPSQETEQQPAKMLQTVLRAVNDYMAVTHAHAGMFVTLFYGILQPETGVFHYANGGHEPPLLVSASGEITPLRPTAPAIGLNAGLPLKVRRITLMPGDTLVAFTDGVTEARNRAGQFFTRERLEAMLKAPAGSAAEISERVESALKKHMNGQAASDDITLLVLRRTVI